MFTPFDGRNGATVALLVLGLLVMALAVAVDKLGVYLRVESAERAGLNAALNPHVQEARRLAGLTPGTGRRRLAHGGVAVDDLTRKMSPTGEGAPPA